MHELDDVQVARLVEPAALVGEIARCLADLGHGRAAQAPKQVLAVPGGGFWLSIAAVVSRLGLAVSKWGSYVPGADGLGGRSTATLLVGESDGGAPHTVIRGVGATHLRTGATAAAVVAALRGWSSVQSVALIGMGPTNRAVLDVVGAVAPVGTRLQVLVRSPASVRRVADLLDQDPRWAGRYHVGTDPWELGGAQVAFSATGARSTVARLADLSAGGLAVSLDGRVTWDAGDAPVLGDQVSPGVAVPTLARVVAGLAPVPAGRLLVDLAGPAVADVALASVALSGMRDRA